jgi:hypothetical protein
MKQKWGKESYSDECTRKERMGIIWLKAGIWKLRGIGRGGSERRFPCLPWEEDANHVLLKCSEAKKWREFICSKLLKINEHIA